MHRRHFLQSLAALSAVSAVPLRAGDSVARAKTGAPAVLSGREFNLTIAPARVNFTGQERVGIAVNGSIPAPTLIWREGEEITLRVTNHLDEVTSIHWHGILLPYTMDGTPGVSFAGIAPGETFTYRFTVRQSGTYWYHSHSGAQEALGLYGALILLPRESDEVVAQDWPLVFSDWSDETPLQIFANLRAESDYYNPDRKSVV